MGLRPVHCHPYHPDGALSRGSGPSSFLAVPSFRFAPPERQAAMNLFELTRALVDIESTTNHEGKVGDYLFAHLSALAARHNGQIERIPVEPNREIGRASC